MIGEYFRAPACWKATGNAWKQWFMNSKKPGDSPLVSGHPTDPADVAFFDPHQIIRVPKPNLLASRLPSHQVADG
jgi:hypothetical protein